MWKYIDTKNKNNYLIKKLAIDILKYDSEIQARHFNEKGKKYFSSLKGIFYLRFLLSSIQDELFEYYQDPIIDHAYLLTKSPGGNKTPPHQDFVFWEKKEKTLLPESMITFWFALCDINESNGSLKLIKKEETYCIKELNKGNEEKLTHKKLKINNSFNFFSEDSKKNGLLESCHILKGNCIAFDAYSLHSSNDNTSNSHRLSLKIVTKEKNKSFNNKKGLEIKKLLNKNLTKSNTYIYLFWAAGIISKFLNYIKSKNFF